MKKRHNIPACGNLHFKNSLKTMGLSSTTAAVKNQNGIFDWSIMVLWVYLILFVEGKIQLGLKYGNTLRCGNLW